MSRLLLFFPLYYNNIWVLDCLLYHFLTFTDKIKTASNY